MALLPDILRLAGENGAAEALRADPVLNHNFAINLVDTSSTLATIGSAMTSAVTDIFLGGFSECTGIEMSMQVEEYKEGGNNGSARKFPGAVSHGNLTLKKGIGTSSVLWDWHYGFVVGKGKRRDGIIALLDERFVPTTIWYFRNGLPVRYGGPAMDATQNTVAIEVIEISHEGLWQVPFVGGAAALSSGLAGGGFGGVAGAAAGGLSAGINL